MKGRKSEAWTSSKRPIVHETAQIVCAYSRCSVWVWSRCVPSSLRGVTALAKFEFAFCVSVRRVVGPVIIAQAFLAEGLGLIITDSLFEEIMLMFLSL